MFKAKVDEQRLSDLVATGMPKNEIVNTIVQEFGVTAAAVYGRLKKIGIKNGDGIKVAIPCKGGCGRKTKAANGFCVICKIGERDVMAKPPTMRKSFVDHLLDSLIGIKGANRGEVIAFIINDWAGDHLSELDYFGILDGYKGK